MEPDEDKEEESDNDDCLDDLNHDSDFPLNEPCGTEHNTPESYEFH